MYLNLKIQQRILKRRLPFIIGEQRVLVYIEQGHSQKNICCEKEEAVSIPKRHCKISTDTDVNPEAKANDIRKGSKYFEYSRGGG